MNLDIFCKIIDNYGDIGFVYRFAKEYLQYRPKSKVRIFLDNLETLHTFHPSVNPKRQIQKVDNITYIFYSDKDTSNIDKVTPAPFIIEAYGCDIPSSYLNHAILKSKLIINLEYLSAEKWIEGYHLKESRLNITQKSSLKKFFFMPGFSVQSGGILIEKKLHKLRTPWKKNRIEFLTNLLSSYQIELPNPKKSILGTLFSYEHHFEELLGALSQLKKEVYLFVFGAKSIHSFNKLQKKYSLSKISPNHKQYQNIHILYCDFLVQNAFDQLLHSTDFNFVRGEDSFVRAILAAKPFVWDIYPMEEDQHFIKLNAFLDVFTPYFSDKQRFNHYRALSILYNQTKTGSIQKQKQAHFDKNKLTNEYLFFFENLSKISYDTKYFRSFLIKNCNLMKNLMSFMKKIPTA